MNTDINKVIITLVVLVILGALVGVIGWLTNGFTSGAKIMEYLTEFGSKIQGWFGTNNVVGGNTSWIAR